jgi:hypothetical protein
MSEEKSKKIHKILSIISGQESKTFADIDDECPSDWSKALKPFGLKLVYCDSKFSYIEENWFSLEDGKYIVETYTDGAWRIGEKLLDMEQRDQHHDFETNLYLVQIQDDDMKALDSSNNLNGFVKRIFQIVPLNHESQIEIPN